MRCIVYIATHQEVPVRYTMPGGEDKYLQGSHPFNPQSLSVTPVRLI